MEGRWQDAGFRERGDRRRRGGNAERFDDRDRSLRSIFGENFEVY